MIRAVPLVFAIVLSASAALAADDSRSPQIVPTREDENVVALELVNPLPYEVTVTVDVADMTGVRADHHFPITATLGSQLKTPLARLTLDPAAGKPKFRPTMVWQPGSPHVRHD